MGNKESSSASSKSSASPQLARPVSKGWVIGPTADINKTYKLGKQLGTPGNYGRAQEATHIATKQKRAVKIINKARFSPDQFEHFRREVELMRTLDHANIIKGVDVFETPSELYIVMEICAGGELFDRIKAKEKYSEKEAAFILRQIFDALNYMHQRKVAHLDLKPDNFLFMDEKDEPVKVIDFGMAKFVKRRQYLHVMAGTSFYMAPEVLRGHYTEHSDMWSLGVVMFIMLFGYPPFHGDPDSKIYEAIKRGFDPRVREGYGAWFPKAIPCSEAARDLISKLLTQDTAKRLTAAEALEHPWLTGKEASAEPMVANVMKNLGNFTASCKLKKAVLSTMATQMNQSDLEALKKSFEQYDENKDGVITINELKKALANSGDEGKIQDLMNLIKMADLDGDGALSYQELVMASVQKQLMAKEERLWNIFSQLDQDGNGKVDADEIVRVLGGESSDVKAMIAEVDKNGDGQVDYDEFLAMWINKEEGLINTDKPEQMPGAKNDSKADKPYPSAH